MAYSPARCQAAHSLVVADGLLQSAAAQLEKRGHEAGADLQQPEAGFTSQPIGLVRMPEAILVTALCRLDLGDDDQRVAGQERLSGGQRQVECLAAVCQRLGP